MHNSAAGETRVGGPAAIRGRWEPLHITSASYWKFGGFASRRQPGERRSRQGACGGAGPTTARIQNHGFSLAPRACWPLPVLSKQIELTKLSGNTVRGIGSATDHRRWLRSEHFPSLRRDEAEPIFLFA